MRPALLLLLAACSSASAPIDAEPDVSTPPRDAGGCVYYDASDFVDNCGDARPDRVGCVFLPTGTDGGGYWVCQK
jgi:hypothetical protein